jgi:hypothetical protein
MAIDVIGCGALRVTWHVSHRLFLASRGLGADDLFLDSAVGRIFLFGAWLSGLLGGLTLPGSIVATGRSGHVWGYCTKFGFGPVISNYCHGVDHMFRTSVLRILSVGELTSS